VPGAAGWRKPRANVANCDTAAMTSFSRWLTRVELTRASAGWLSLAILALVGAYGFAAYYSRPTPGGLVAAVALVALASSGLLYAWRPGTGGPGD
jgi:hypothetical protein